MCFCVYNNDSEGVRGTAETQSHHIWTQKYFKNFNSRKEDTRMKRQRRNKGEGSITKLPSGKYKITITIGRDVTGKQRRKSVTASTRKELLDKAAELRLQHNLLSKEEQQALLQNKTYQEITEEWFTCKQSQLAAATLKTVATIDKTHIFPYIGSLHPSEITSETLERLFRDKQGQGYMQGTLKSIKRRIGTIFNYMIRRKYIKTSPLVSAEIMIKDTNRKANMILPSKEEMQKLLIELRKDYPITYYPFVLTAILTGMRKGEILGLKWDRIDFKKKTIKIDNQIDVYNTDAPLKTQSSYRTIHVSQKLLHVLDVIPRQSKYVFTSRGTHYSASIIYSIMKTLRKKGLQPQITFHDFRHYHATQLLAKGVDVKTVSRRLGHKSVTTTLDVYYNYLPALDDKASTLLDTLVD